MFRSWNNARVFEDIEDQDLKAPMKDDKLLLWIIQRGVEKHHGPDQKMTADDLELLAKCVLHNIAIEIARRVVAFDRAKLKHFSYIEIDDLIDPQTFPKGEFARAYTMRHRERTGEEITEEELDDISITI